MHPAYVELIRKAEHSHRQFRSPADITPEDVCRARLYSYAYRCQTIGTFHATRVALESRPAVGALALAHRERVVEVLTDLANQAMETVPDDFRAAIATLHRYHVGVERIARGLRREFDASQDARLPEILTHFAHAVDAIQSCCGIYLTQDQEAPTQASFVVPNLGIVIVPLVYGDRHSWNLAYLAGEARNVPVHRHRQGVEIHLGYNPTHGQTILGKHRAVVDEGYAMPIPPETDHGWINTSETPHHVPFIFGSNHLSGWGIFLDVEPQTTPVEALTRETGRDSVPFSQMVYLEREIDRTASLQSSLRRILIESSVTNRRQCGGLELGVLRANRHGLDFPRDEFRIVSIARGEGIVTISGIEQTVRAHDHFGVPGGMDARLRQTSDQPLVALDALLRR